LPEPADSIGVRHRRKDATTAPMTLHLISSLVVLLVMGAVGTVVGIRGVRAKVTG
jgi:hypothetical protein